jgi:hypothetical protein
VLHAIAFRKADLYHFHGMGNSLFLPLVKLARKRSVVTIDGPDWERPKWGRLARFVLKLSARLCVKYADALIIDNFSAQDYFEQHFGTRGVYIPGGGGRDGGAGSAGSGATALSHLRRAAHSRQRLSHPGRGLEASANRYEAGAGGRQPLLQGIHPRAQGQRR